MKKLSKFACGYIVALSTIVHDDGIQPICIQMYEDIGSPTIKQLEQADLTEYDIEAIQKIIHDIAGGD